MVEVELAQDANAFLGEGPIGDHRTAELIWVDIPAGTVHRLDPISGRDRELPSGPTGGVRGIA
jgi:sugar lactone lactonase YvrE